LATAFILKVVLRDKDYLVTLIINIFFKLNQGTMFFKLINLGKPQANNFGRSALLSKKAIVTSLAYFGR